MHDDPVAPLGEAPGERRAHAAGGTGDEDAPAALGDLLGAWTDAARDRDGRRAAAGSSGHPRRAGAPDGLNADGPTAQTSLRISRPCTVTA